MAIEPPRPYRVVVDGISLNVNCEVLTVAVREAEKLAQRMKADVHIYKGAELVRTVKATE